MATNTPLWPEANDFSGILKERETFGTGQNDDAADQINTWFDDLMLQAGLPISPSMLLAQTVQPAEHQTQTVPTEHQTQTVQPTEHQTGIIDTELEQADSIHCAVVREDLRDDKVLLSECPHEPRP